MLPVLRGGSNAPANVLPTAAKYPGYIQYSKVKLLDARKRSSNIMSCHSFLYRGNKKHKIYVNRETELHDSLTGQTLYAPKYLSAYSAIVCCFNSMQNKKFSFYNLIYLPSILMLTCLSLTRFSEFP